MVTTAIILALLGFMFVLYAMFYVGAGKERPARHAFDRYGELSRYLNTHYVEEKRNTQKPETVREETQAQPDLVSGERRPEVQLPGAQQRQRSGQLGAEQTKRVPEQMDAAASE